MIPYADTNFFTNSLLELSHSAAADELLLTHQKKRCPPLPATWLVTAGIDQRFTAVGV